VTAARLHHVGLVVREIGPVAERSAHYLHAEWDGAIHHDPLQNVRVSFLSSGIPDATSIELVEPVDETSPVVEFLRRGGGLHHLCYEVDSLAEQLERCRADGAAVVRPPLPAVAFEGRRICWTVNRDRLLVEWLER
jgi:methylmalonyl-CoA/ethylmalonyl-CoA epimerase